MARFTTDNAASFGRRGGLRTVERHGTEHMRRIGEKGFWVMVVRHWEANPRAFVNWFVAVGLAATDPMPHNSAYCHDRHLLRIQCLYGHLNRLPRWWTPPAFPADLEPPY